MRLIMHTHSTYCHYQYHFTHTCISLVHTLCSRIRIHTSLYTHIQMIQSKHTSSYNPFHLSYYVYTYTYVIIMLIATYSVTQLHIHGSHIYIMHHCSYTYVLYHSMPHMDSRLIQYHLHLYMYIFSYQHTQITIYLFLFHIHIELIIMIILSYHNTQHTHSYITYMYNMHTNHILISLHFKTVRACLENTIFLFI